MSRSHANDNKFLMLHKKIILDQVRNKVYLGSLRSDFYFVKRSWPALTSFVYTICYHFMK